MSPSYPLQEQSTFIAVPITFIGKIVSTYFVYLEVLIEKIDTIYYHKISKKKNTPFASVRMIRLCETVPFVLQVYETFVCVDVIFFSLFLSLFFNFIF